MKKTSSKSKRLGLNQYRWPEENIGEGNFKRPITAGNVAGRPGSNFDSKRRQIQSRGKPVAMGLSGTSQEDQEGKLSLINIFRWILSSRSIL